MVQVLQAHRTHLEASSIAWDLAPVEVCDIGKQAVSPAVQAWHEVLSGVGCGVHGGHVYRVHGG